MSGKVKNGRIKKRHEASRLPVRRILTLSSTICAAISFLLGVASSVLALFARTDLAIGYTILAVVCYIAVLLIFDCMNGPNYVEEQRDATPVLGAILLLLCAVMAALSIAISFVATDVYGYDHVTYNGSVDGEPFTETVIYTEETIGTYRAFILAFAITSIVLCTIFSCFSFLCVLLKEGFFGNPQEREEVSDVPVVVKSDDGQKTIDLIPPFDGDDGSKDIRLRSRIAMLEQLYRSGIISEEVYHELKNKILSPDGWGDPGEGTNVNGENTDMLISGTSYGTKAQDIYDICCEKYGWQRGKRGMFGSQQKLFAENVTPEGYAVWFISNSNLTGKTNGRIRNIVDTVAGTVTEEWSEPLDYVVAPRRLIFIKDEQGRYIFFGVHKCTVDRLHRRKVSVRISDRYPE